MLCPDYRVVLNGNLLKFPEFEFYLKQEFRRLVYQAVAVGKMDLDQVYKFTVLAVPAEFGDQVAYLIQAEAGLYSLTEKEEEILEMLKKLDPVDPVPVDLEFTLGQIVSFVCGHVLFYDETVPGGVVHYFGIPLNLWFDGYPIQTGTVVRAVDYGTLDNFPLHLFDAVFQRLRETVLDLFIQFRNGFNPNDNGMRIEVVTHEEEPDADI